MTIDTENLLNSILQSLDRIKFVNSDDIPSIDLYMDQVTTFMEKNLKDSTRYKGEDKILTKTMINNYAKNDLLPPSYKKKYSKEHVLVLIFIYYFKNILSISDIQKLLNPLTEKYFENSDGLTIKAIYDEVCTLGDAQIEELKKSVKEKYLKSAECFADSKAEDQEELQLFAFICTLIFDVYMKKLLIEKMIDDYTQKHSSDEEEPDSKKEKKKDTKSK